MTAEQARRAILARERLRRVRECTPPPPEPVTAATPTEEDPPRDR